MKPQPIHETPVEAALLAKFRSSHPYFFRKDDSALYRHLGVVAAWIFVFTAGAILFPSVIFKILYGAGAAFGWFCLINVTIHHHHTHKNAAKDPRAKKLLDFIYFIAVPNAPKRLPRYTRAHLNHHARPFHETDVDHHYGLERYEEMSRTPLGKLLYYLELTFVGAHVPGWQDDRYMNTVPLETWNRRDYEAVKAEEIRAARITALWQWALFFVALKFMPVVAWGWAFPMLLVKNWAHYLGQFQHYNEDLRNPARSVAARTQTFRGVPEWLNWLTGGELTGHFLHHLYPEMPYYYVETARKMFAADPDLSKAFVIY